ncbi:MAG: tetratricopeptide repeat protein [Bacteroidetes bacterium]|nr:tetratricopeptide repeat protein [Bacteroidota bacterium]
MKWVISFVFIPLLWSPSLLHGQEMERFLSNQQIIKMMEKSPTSYEVKSLRDLDGIPPDKLRKEIFPDLNQLIEYPLIEEDDSSLSVSSFEFDSLALSVLMEGEEYYQSGNYQKALSYYEKAIQISEKFYIAYLNAGDCHLMQGNLSQALQYYEKAHEINPYDYRTSFFQGTVYLRNGDYSNAKKCYIKALSLKPRHQNLMFLLKSKEKELGIRVNSRRFEPIAVVRKEGDGVAIYVDEDREPFWISYAFAKSIWIGEKDYRSRISASNDSGWNSRAEKQAILSMLETYMIMIEEDPKNRNEYCELILKIANDGYLDEFILYEIASQMNPNIVLSVPGKYKDRIREYVERYVITDLN